MDLKFPFSFNSTLLYWMGLNKDEKLLYFVLEWGDDPVCYFTEKEPQNDYYICKIVYFKHYKIELWANYDFFVNEDISINNVEKIDTNFIVNCLKYSIRRQNKSIALKACKSLFYYDENLLLKTLVSSMMEDVGYLDNQFKILVWLIARDEQIISKEVVEWLLGLVYTLCEEISTYRIENEDISISKRFIFELYNFFDKTKLKINENYEKSSIFIDIDHVSTLELNDIKKNAIYSIEKGLIENFIENNKVNESYSFVKECVSKFRININTRNNNYDLEKVNNPIMYQYYKSIEKLLDEEAIRILFNNALKNF